MNFEIIEGVNDIGRRAFTVRNVKTGRELGRYTYWIDAANRVVYLDSMLKTGVLL